MVRQVVPETIALCVIGYEAQSRWMLRTVEHCHSHVDEIHIQGDDLGPDTVAAFKALSPKVQVWNEPWKEDFSAYKNACSNRATTGWVCDPDGDEVPSRALAENLRRLVKESDNASKYNAVTFWSVNQTVHESTLDVLDEGMGRGKALLHVNVQNAFRGDVHVWWAGKVKFNVVESGLAYYHMKERRAGIERSVRNAAMGGGGDTQRGPAWRLLQKALNVHGIVGHKAFDSLLRSGEVPDDIKAAMEAMFVEDSNLNDEDKKDPKIYYLFMHPEKAWGVPLDREPRARRWLKELAKLKLLDEQGRLMR